MRRHVAGLLVRYLVGTVIDARDRRLRQLADPMAVLGLPLMPSWNGRATLVSPRPTLSARSASFTIAAARQRQSAHASRARRLGSGPRQTIPLSRVSPVSVLEAQLRQRPRIHAAAGWRRQARARVGHKPASGAGALSTGNRRDLASDRCCRANAVNHHTSVGPVARVGGRQQMPGTSDVGGAASIQGASPA